MLLVALLALTAPASATEVIEEILAQHLEAVGGADAIHAVHSMKVEAEIEMLGMGVTGKMESFSVRPCLYRGNVSLGFFQVKQGYDGERIWRVDPNGMLLIMQDEQSVRDQVTRCIIDSYRYLYPSDEFSTRVAGRDTIDGSECVVIELEPDRGTACKLYIDSKTFLMKRLTMESGSASVHETFEDYREVDGLMIPFVSRLHQTALNQTVESRIIAVALNERIDPIIFLPPSGFAKDYEFIEGHSAELIPFTYYESHIYFPVRFPGSDGEVMFMLDTGASMTVVDSTFAALMDFPLGERMLGAGAGGLANFYMTKIPGFSIEGLGFGEQTVIAYPIRKIMSRFVDVDVYGILGYDFLSRFITRIDYERALISFFEPDSFDLSLDAEFLEAPLRHNVFGVEASLDGTYRGTFLIDTGASNSIIQKSFADEHGLAEGREGLEITLLGAGGEEDALLARFDSFEIGDFEIDGPVFALSETESGIAAFEDISGIIGNDILHRFTLTLDYKNQRILLEPNGLFGDPFIKDRSGIRCERHEDGRVTIYSVIPGSPGDDAGLREGDEIISIEGRPVEDIERMEEIFELLRETERERLRLEIKRRGVKSSVSIILRDYI
jgi:hypothetical protein